MTALERRLTVLADRTVFTACVRRAFLGCAQGSAYVTFNYERHAETTLCALFLLTFPCVCSLCVRRGAPT